MEHETATAARLAPEVGALVDLHRRNNVTTSRSWERFAAHRARMTELALAAGGDDLVILGAGNCNDVDLSVLAAHHRAIHLVDIDETAVSRARDGQPLDVRRRLIARAPVDLSGSMGGLARYRNRSPTAAELGTWPARACARIREAVPEVFDTALSACVLSQLMHTCAEGLGRENPFLQVIACATVVAHLRALVAMVRPGGIALLVTDVALANTESPPPAWRNGDPLDLLAKIDGNGETFYGASPSFLLQILSEDPYIAPAAGPPRLVEPWIWSFSEKVTYLVCGIAVTKRDTAP